MGLFLLCLANFMCRTVSGSIHIVANGKISFFYSIVYMFPIFFICSSVDGHIGCLHILATGNNATVNRGYISCQRVISFLSNKNPEVELPDHMVVLFLIF